MKYKILCLFDGTYLAKFPLTKTFGLCHESNTSWAGIESAATFNSFEDAFKALQEMCRRKHNFRVDGNEFPIFEEELLIYFEIVVS